ncbi:hypothetical protein BSM4216_1639 [Bacillus smithii]|nr:hypothetical protein BSM4216_1639 [Bacillus smithii]
MGIKRNNGTIGQLMKWAASFFCRLFHTFGSSHTLHNVVYEY